MCVCARAFVEELVLTSPPLCRNLGHFHETDTQASLKVGSRFRSLPCFWLRSVFVLSHGACQSEEVGVAE